MDLGELNLRLQFYLAYKKTSTTVQIIEEKEWRRKIINGIKIKNKRINTYKLKMYGNQVLRTKSPTMAQKTC